MMQTPAGDGPLTLTLALDGATAAAAANGVKLTLPGGRRLVYDRLRVTDATGRVLDSRLTVRADRTLAIRVADAGARYPLTIDPTLTDADWSALGSGLNREVRALAVAGNDLYVGGLFTTAGGAPANYIAKWNGSAWSTLGSGLSCAVVALALAGSDLYVGGCFTSAGGAAANRIAKWNTAASDDSGWSVLGSGLGYGTVFALAVAGDDLYVGGDFTTAGGAPASHIAKWNGSAWSTLGSGLGSGPNNTVVALAVAGSDLYVGGSFTSVGGVAGRNHIAKWNTAASDDSGWSALGSGLDWAVLALAVADSDLYVGGLFTTAGGAPANHIAKWNGSAWSALGSGLEGQSIYDRPNALAVAGGKLYAGGSFTTAGGKASPYAAYMHLTPTPCGAGLPLTTGVGALWQPQALPCVPDTATVQGALGSGGSGNLLAGNYDSGATNYKNKTHWWRLYHYDAGAPGYVLPALGDDVFTGTGYWLKSFDAPAGGGYLTVTGTATPAPVTQGEGCAVANCKAIGLYVAADRYNLVGNPFPYKVDWSKVRIRVGGAGGTVYTPSQAAGIGSGAANPAVLSKQIWIWNGTTYETWDDVTHKGNLQYFKSFWVKVLPGAVGKTIELLIPAEASTLSQAAPASMPWLDGVAPPARAANGDWQVRLTVTNKVTGWQDTTNLLGQKATAKPGYDAHDLAELAPFATPYLSLVFPHADWPTLNGQKRAGDYATDFRPAAGNRSTDWTFELRASPTGGKVFITWQADPVILKRSRLVDLQTGTVIDPTAPKYAQGYPVALKTSLRRYQWRYLGR
ncbi:MAG: hypothetical protein ACKN9W_04820 [Methylococcus sp.]